MSEENNSHEVKHRSSVPGFTLDTQTRLPFTIRIASDDERLRKAIVIRSDAYGRHLPELGDRLRKIEPTDVEAGVTVLLAESKYGGTPLGTIRIQTNLFRPLLIEQVVDLPYPEMIQAEVTRLAVCQKAIGRLVKWALFRATYQFCLLHDIHRIVVGARPPLDRPYRGLLFQNLLPGGEAIRLAYAGNIAHYIMYLDIPTAAARWKAANHPMYEFLTAAEHPDIDLAADRKIYVVFPTHVPISPKESSMNLSIP